MLEGVVDVAFAFVDRYGPLALFCIFVLEGLLVGKLIPTRTLFVAAVVIVENATLELAVLAGAAILGATVGQTLLFAAVRLRGTAWLGRVPYVRATRDRVRRAERWFDRWGLPTVAVTNALPIVRGYPTIPVAISTVSWYRFPPVSMLGTTVYVGALTAIALGLEVLVPWL